MIRVGMTIGAAAALVMASMAAPSGQERASGNSRDLPAAVTQAIQSNRPGAEIDKLDVEKEHVPEPVAAAIRTASKGRAIKRIKRSEVQAEIVNENDKARVPNCPRRSMCTKRS
jgi:hypothetical protein